MRVTPIRSCLLLSLLLALTTSPLTASAGAPAAAPEARASACPDSIRLGGKRYAFYERRVSCANARRAVRRLYDSYGKRGRPRGFRCQSRSRFRKTGGCTNSRRTRYFGFSR